MQTEQKAATISGHDLPKSFNLLLSIFWLESNQQRLEIIMKNRTKEGKKRTSAYLKKFTVVVFGDSRVGKTSLCKAFLGEQFKDDYVPTIEDFYSTQIEYKERNYQVDIIDTCGTETFPAMRRVEINKADAIVLVYSLDQLRSFEWLEQIQEEIFQQRGNNLPVMVVANKVDVVLEANALNITTKEGRTINTRNVAEKEWGYSWVMTSAKLALGIKEIFDVLIDTFQTRRSQSLPAKSSSSFLRRSPLLSTLRRKSK